RDNHRSAPLSRRAQKCASSDTSVGQRIDRDHTLWSSVINTIKKKEVDRRCMLPGDTKICPIRRKGCSQRRTSPLVGLFCHGTNERLGYFSKSRRRGG